MQWNWSSSNRNKLKIKLNPQSQNECLDTAMIILPIFLNRNRLPVMRKKIKLKILSSYFYGEVKKYTIKFTYNHVVMMNLFFSRGSWLRFLFCQELCPLTSALADIVVPYRGNTLTHFKVYNRRRNRKLWRPKSRVTLIIASVNNSFL